VYRIARQLGIKRDYSRTPLVTVTRVDSNTISLFSQGFLMRLWHICLCIYGCLDINSRINLLFCTQSDFYRYPSFVVVSCATFFPLHPIIPNSGKKTLEKNLWGKNSKEKNQKKSNPKKETLTLGTEIRTDQLSLKAKRKRFVDGFYSGDDSS